MALQCKCDKCGKELENFYKLEFHVTVHGPAHPPTFGSLFNGEYVAHGEEHYCKGCFKEKIKKRIEK